MNDPPRLIDALPTSLAAALLRAGEAEPLPEKTLQRTLAGLGIGATIISTGTTAGASSTLAGGGAATTAGVTMVAKWVGAGLLGGLLAAGTAAELFSYAEPDPKGSGALPAIAPPSPTSTSAQPQRAEPELPPETPDALPPHDSAPSRPATGTQVAPDDRRDTTAGEPTDAAVHVAEVRLIDAAWTAFRRRDYEATLAHLSSYESQARSESFRPEALFLRMESELALGHAELAKSHARKLLARFPRGPHARRAQAVLELP